MCQYIIEDKFFCLFCDKELRNKEEPCPDCRCTEKSTAVNITPTDLKVGDSLMIKIPNDMGKPVFKFYHKRKLSKCGKEAEEELRIYVARNRKYHHVKEKNENGVWCDVHHEDKPLKEKSPNSD